MSSRSKSKSKDKGRSKSRKGRSKSKGKSRGSRSEGIPATLIFHKEAFPTKASVKSWLAKHPSLDKAVQIKESGPSWRAVINEITKSQKASGYFRTKVFSPGRISLLLFIKT